MEHPYALNEIRRKPRDRKRLAAETIRRATRQAPRFAPLPPLPTIPDVELLTPGSPKYDEYLPASNLRTTVRPALRALCKTEQSVAAVLNWVRTNGLPFALRCGGHSFEGFSQSANVVIDTRKIDDVTLDAGSQMVTVGAGASLGTVYEALNGSGFAFAAGSCPTVGVAGHALGGGFGLLGRAYGLTCDNLVSLNIVDADGGILTIDAQQHPDLFWACRGGGGGSFGIATKFRFRVQVLPRVVVFGVTWALSTAKAVRLFDAWQRWAPAAPNAITSIMKVGRRSDGNMSLRCIGQSTGFGSGAAQRARRAADARAADVASADADAELLRRRRSFLRRLRLRDDIHERKVRLRPQWPQQRRNRRPDGGAATHPGRSRRRVVRRLRRNGRERGSRRNRLSAPRPINILHSILFQLGARGRYAATAEKHVESVRGDASPCPGRVLRELLRPGPAGLAERVLGIKSRSPQKHQVAIRPFERLRTRSKRSAAGLACPLLTPLNRATRGSRHSGSSSPTLQLVHVVRFCHSLAITT